jgi:hypothetical protein
MWSPPIALTSEEQKIAARTRKTRKFFVFLREHRHELLDPDFQYILAQSYSPEPSGQEPVEAGLLALATLLQAYWHVGDRDAVELTVMVAYLLAADIVSGPLLIRLREVNPPVIITRNRCSRPRPRLVTCI